ncbi:hypothetical protein BDN72DRAFT_891615 [Pluteus cervinus]|uniref:Uncharacterized protein n=1 Tax=Pluteus cervinus TaxID=181527 RepID=A0ACD3BEP8_9AGAR|nr:hypothetical protein BDN72DRAFT_891615 [Pluteus cervinus]
MSTMPTLPNTINGYVFSPGYCPQPQSQMASPFEYSPQVGPSHINPALQPQPQTVPQPSPMSTGTQIQHTELAYMQLKMENQILRFQVDSLTKQLERADEEVKQWREAFTKTTTLVSSLPTVKQDTTPSPLASPQVTSFPSLSPEDEKPVDMLSGRIPTIKVPKEIRDEAFKVCFPAGYKAYTEGTISTPVDIYGGKVKYWKQEQWTNEEKDDEKDDDDDGQEDQVVGTKRRRQVNDPTPAKKQLYLHQTTGEYINGKSLDNLRKNGLNPGFNTMAKINLNLLPPSWVIIDQCDPEYAAIAYAEVESWCPEFALCDNHWKARMFLTAWYKQWWKNQFDPPTRNKRQRQASNAKKDEQEKIEQDLEQELKAKRLSELPPLVDPLYSRPLDEFDSMLMNFPSRPLKTPTVVVASATPTQYPRPRPANASRTSNPSASTSTNERQEPSIDEPASSQASPLALDVRIENEDDAGEGQAKEDSTNGAEPTPEPTRNGPANDDIIAGSFDEFIPDEVPEISTEPSKTVKTTKTAPKKAAPAVRKTDKTTTAVVPNATTLKNVAKKAWKVDNPSKRVKDFDQYWSGLGPDERKIRGLAIWNAENQSKGSSSNGQEPATNDDLRRISNNIDWISKGLGGLDGSGWIGLDWE